MTPEQTREAAAVMLAFADGKKIEWYDRHCHKWIAVDAAKWDWLSCDYRVAPEPWTAKIWVHSDGGILDGADENWKPRAPGWRFITVKEVVDE